MDHEKSTTHLHPNTTQPHKNNRRLILIILTVILCLVIAGISILIINKNERKVKEQTTKQSTSFKDISFDSTVEWNDEYRLHVMYPITNQGQLDKTARASIDEYVHSFREAVATKPEGSKPYELNMLGSVNYASKTALNFVYTGTWLIDGNKSNLTVNMLFDRTSGKEIRTSDLFKDSAYLQTASDTARKELPGILGSMNYDKTLVEKGTTPTTAHFDQFEIVDNKSINLVFEPGQVANVSLGIIKVPVPLDSLNSDLNDAIVGKIFPEYIAQVQAAAKAQAEAAAAAQKAAEDAKAKKSPSASLPANGNTDCTKAKCIALTFDDGPGPGTASILDTLKTNNVKGTFMVVGSRVAAGASLVEREHAEGHDIGNHTWDHGDLTNMSIADAQSEVDKTSQAVANVIGKRPYFVRPPYGAYNTSVLNAIGMPFILWDVDPDDWKDRDADIVYQRVMAGAKPGAIILSHDLYPTTAAAYQRIVPDLIKQGYTLVTVSDLLNISPSNAPAQVFSHQP